MGAILDSKDDSASALYGVTCITIEPGERGKKASVIPDLRLRHDKEEVLSNSSKGPHMVNTNLKSEKDNQNMVSIQDMEE